MAHQLQLENEKYRQWVKAGLGLRYLKEGLTPFCNDIAYQQHKDILQNIWSTKKSLLSTVTCGSCRVETLKPDHKPVLGNARNKVCPFGQVKCSCCFLKVKIACPNNICGAIYDYIVQQHASSPPSPYWKNTDAQQWTIDPWSICKCFINAPGYEDRQSASVTDSTGLLHVLINNKYFHSHIGCNVTGTNNLLSKVRQYRNTIFHSSSMELEESEANMYIEDMIAVLQDGRELLQRSDTQIAVTKLQDLKKKDFIVTTEDFKEILRQIKEELAKVQKLAENSPTKEEYEELKNKLETQMSKLKEEIKRLKENDSPQQKQLRYEKAKSAMRKKLIDQYYKTLLQVPTSPVQPHSEKCSFSEIYIRPTITMEKKVGKGETKEMEVKTMSEIFTKNGIPQKSVYLVGDAGSGKTSFCKYLVNCWCLAHSDKLEDEIEHEDGHKKHRGDNVNEKVNEELEDEIEHEDCYKKHRDDIVNEKVNEKYDGDNKESKENNDGGGNNEKNRSCNENEVGNDKHKKHVIDVVNKEETEGHEGENDEHGGDKEKHNGDNEEHGRENDEHAADSDKHGRDKKEQVGDKEKQGGDCEEHAGENKEHRDDNEKHGGDSEKNDCDSEEHGGGNEEHECDNEEHGSDNKNHRSDSEKHEGDSKKNGGDIEEHGGDSEKTRSVRKEHGGDSEDHGSENKEHGCDSEKHGSDKEKQVGDNEEHGVDSEEHDCDYEKHFGESLKLAGDRKQQVCDNEEHGVDSKEHGGDNVKHRSCIDEHGGDSEEHYGDKEEQVGVNKEHGDDRKEQGGVNGERRGDNKKHGGDSEEHGGDNTEHEGDNEKHDNDKEEQVGVSEKHKGENEKHEGCNNEHGGDRKEHGGDNEEHRGQNEKHGGDSEEHEGDSEKHGRDYKKHGGDTEKHRRDKVEQVGNNKKHGCDSEQHDSDIEEHGGNNKEHGDVTEEHGGDSKEHGSVSEKHGGENEEHGRDNEEHGGDNEKHGGDNEKHLDDSEKHGRENEEHGSGNEKHGGDCWKHGVDNEKHDCDSEKHFGDSVKHVGANEEHGVSNEGHESERKKQGCDNDKHLCDNEEHGVDSAKHVDDCGEDRGNNKENEDDIAEYGAGRKKRRDKSEKHGGDNEENGGDKKEKMKKMKKMCDEYALQIRRDQYGLCGTKTKEIEDMDYRAEEVGYDSKTYEQVFMGIKEMKKYEFVFYIPLRQYHNIDTIDIMLQKRYEIEILITLLEKESSRVLILLDGIDEWSSENVLGNSTFKEYTIVTTSRPWKFYTLRCSGVNIEQSLKLKGFDLKCEREMVNRTVLQLNNRKHADKDARDCRTKLEEKSLGSLKQVPIVLQHLICLWYDDKLDKTSRCAIYTGMLELFFTWKNIKTAGKRTRHIEGTEKVNLPKYLADKTDLESNSHFIYDVSHLAYETLFNCPKNKSLAFDMCLFHELDISDEVRENCLKLGIMTEDERPNLTVSEPSSSLFSFIHKSMQEFLAAVNICINFNTNIGSSNSTGNDELAKSCYQFIESVFQKCSTVNDILEQSSCMIMLCGLEPKLATHVSKYIYDTVSKDSRVKEYRRTVNTQTDGDVSYFLTDSESINYNILFTDIHQLVFALIEECKESSTPAFYLGDLIIDELNQFCDNVYSRIKKKSIATDSVLSIRVSYSNADYVKFTKYLPKFRHLEKLEITYQIKLQHQLLSGINYEKLDEISFNDQLKHYWFSSTQNDSTVQRNTQMIDEINKCTSKIIKRNILTLKSLSLSIGCRYDSRKKYRNYYPVCRTVVSNLPCMKKLVAIRMSYIIMSHDDTTTFCNFLAGNSNLEQIHLHEVMCDCYNQHYVNLSRRLKYLYLCDAVSVTDVDTTNLEIFRYANLNSFDYSKISKILRKSNKLKELELHAIYDPISHLHHNLIGESLVTVHTLRMLRLHRFRLTDNIIQLPSQMNSLNDIELHDVTMTLTTWKKFVDSLPSIPHTVNVKVLQCCITDDVEKELNENRFLFLEQDSSFNGSKGADAKQYVKDRDKLFHIKLIDKYNAEFSTKKEIKNSSN